MLKELYEKNSEFHGYVDRYRGSKYSVSEALSHAIILEVSKQYTPKKNK